MELKLENVTTGETSRLLAYLTSADLCWRKDPSRPGRPPSWNRPPEYQLGTLANWPLPEDTLLPKERRVELTEASAVILSTSANQCAPLSSLAGSSPANSKWLPGKGEPAEAGPPPENEQELEKGMKAYKTVGQPLSDTYLLRDKAPLLRHLCTSTVYYLLCWTE